MLNWVREQAFRYESVAPVFMSATGTSCRLSMPGQRRSLAQRRAQSRKQNYIADIAREVFQCALAQSGEIPLRGLVLERLPELGRVRVPLTGARAIRSSPTRQCSRASPVLSASASEFVISKSS